jgi:hypothetical protein
MKLKIIIFAGLLILAHILTESAEIIERLVPRIKTMKIHPFLHYEWPHDPEGFPLLWWIKYNTEEFLWCCTFFVMAQIAREYSYKMFRVSLVLFCYHMIDWFMLWYNYKQTHFMYWIGGAGLIVCFIFLILPEKKEAKVKSML